MLTDFKGDDTQKLFSEAIKSLREGEMYGFQCDGTVVLTSDRKMLEKLKQAQQQDIELKGEVKPQIEPIDQPLLAGFEAPLVISMYFPNLLFFRQGEYSDGFRYGAKVIGGEKTLILSDDAKKLKKFVSPVVEKHLDDFGINLETHSFFQDPLEPVLNADFVVNNKSLNLMNDGCYSSRLLLQSAVDNMIFAINDAQKEPSGKEDGGKC